MKSIAFHLPMHGLIGKTNGQFRTAFRSECGISVTLNVHKFLEKETA